MKTMLLRCGVLAVMAAPLAMAGCQSNPRPGPTGVTRSDERIYGETRDPAADTVTLTDFSNRVSQALAMRISSIDEIKNSPTKVVVQLGGIDNRTRTPTNDYEQIRRRVFAGLVNSDYVRRYADIVESPEILDAQRARLVNNQGGGTAGRYDPNLVYVLQGYFGEQVRLGGGVSNYYLEMSLTNLNTGRMLFTETYDFKQVR